MKTDSLDPEVMLVAGGLREPELVAEAARHVEADDITDEGLRLVWKNLTAMIDESVPADQIDVLSVAARCGKTKSMQHAIAKHCDSLMDGMPKLGSLLHYAKDVRRRATLRYAVAKMEGLIKDVKEQATATMVDMPELEERLTNLSVEVMERGDKDVLRTVFKDSSKEVEGYFDQLILGPPADAIPTGIWTLDQKLQGGLRPGKLYTLVAPTGGGKTALASQIADHAVSKGKRAVLFSMEVDPLDVYIRDVERVAGRSRWDLRSKSHDMRTNAHNDILAAQGKLLTQVNTKVVYGEPMSVVGMRQAILTERLRGGPIALVVVDHAQVAKPSKEEKAGMPRYLEVKGIAAGMRQIAQKLNVAVLMTAQMNPPQKNETPSMALIRESKDIANSSDGVMILWHTKEEAPDGEVFVTGTYIKVDKIRAGTMGKVRVKFRGDIFRFEAEDLEGTE